MLSNVYIQTLLSVTGCAQEFSFSAVFHSPDQLFRQMRAPLITIRLQIIGLIMNLGRDLVLKSFNCLMIFCENRGMRILQFRSFFYLLQSSEDYLRILKKLKNFFFKYCLTLKKIIFEKLISCIFLGRTQGTKKCSDESSNI